MTEIPHKDAIIKIISAFYPDAKIYLFGSFARGTQRDSSDIDIAINVGKRLDIHEHAFLANLLDALPSTRKIDLIDLNRLNNASMRQDIETKGVIWKV